MQNLTMTLFLAVGGLVASAAVGASWVATVGSSWNQSSSNELTEWLDQTGGNVFCGSIDDGDPWNFLWDVRDQELEIRFDGSRVRDFVVDMIGTHRMEFSGELVAGDPTVYGSLELDDDKRRFKALSRAGLSDRPPNQLRV